VRINEHISSLTSFLLLTGLKYALGWTQGCRVFPLTCPEHPQKVDLNNWVLLLADLAAASQFASLEAAIVLVQVP